MIASGGLSGGLSSSIAGGSFADGFRQGVITSGLNHAMNHMAQNTDPKINIEVTDEIVGEHTYQSGGKKYVTPKYKAIVTGEDIDGNPIKETFEVTRYGVKNGKIQSLTAGKYKVTAFEPFLDGNSNIKGLRINGSRYLFHTQSDPERRADLNYGCIAMSDAHWKRFQTTLINAGWGLDLAYIARNQFINVQINYAPTPTIKWK
jgi:hypothetical protein